MAIHYTLSVTRAERSSSRTLFLCICSLMHASIIGPSLYFIHLLFLFPSSEQEGDFYSATDDHACVVAMVTRSQRAKCNLWLHAAFMNTWHMFSGVMFGSL